MSNLIGPILVIIVLLPLLALKPTIKSLTDKRFIFFIFFSPICLMLFFAIIYMCLYTVNPQSFEGVYTTNCISQLIDFLYFSISAFLTAGLSTIRPLTTSAKLLVSLQLLYAFGIIGIMLSSSVFFSRENSNN